MSMESEKPSEIWNHWGYSVWPVFLIVFSISCMLISLIPQIGSYLGISDQIVSHIQDHDTQVVFLMIIGFSFWPLKWTLPWILNKQSKVTHSDNQ